jgi:hypothetical protein
MKRPALQAEILQYLLHNTDATETPEGINRVWLGRANTPEMIVEVERALDDLVREGQLERHRLPGGVGAYRRARD